MTSDLKNMRSIGQLVAQYPATADVLARHQIDFCCGGGQTLEEAADKAGLLADALEAELQLALQRKVEAPDMQWSISDLVHHIVDVHHAYVREKTPIIQQYLSRIVKVHGRKYPHLHEVQQLFATSATDMTSHMYFEEKSVFPLCIDMEIVGVSVNAHFQQLLDILKADHSQEGARFARIAALTTEYQAPADACATFRAAYAALEDYHKQLLQHVHLENNVLMEKLMALTPSEGQ